MLSLRVSLSKLGHNLVSTGRRALSYQYTKRSDGTDSSGKVQATAIKTIDLRSDVLSKPSPEMMRVMVETACYGDDVFEENTTVKDLEARVASMLGKEAGLFVTSGTMGNMLPLMAHCRVRGSEVILGDLCHVHMFEQGSLASLAGVHHRAAATKPDGTLCLEQCNDLVRLWPDDPHFPATRALCLENTHGLTGGKALSVEYFAKAREFCDRHGIKLHLDGARLLNATVARNVEPIDYTKHVDSVTICFSKGLGAPVGSCIAADAETIKYCRRARKSLGGGARQPGMLAAAAAHSLDEAVNTLTKDHANAQFIHAGVSGGLTLPKWLTFDKPDTNILLLTINNIKDAPVTIDKLQNLIEEPSPDCPVRLKAPAISKSTIRMLTHNGVSREDSKLTMEKILWALSALA